MIAMTTSNSMRVKPRDLRTIALLLGKDGKKTDRRSEETNQWARCRTARGFQPLYNYLDVIRGEATWRQVVCQENSVPYRSSPKSLPRLPDCQAHARSGCLTMQREVSLNRQRLERFLPGVVDRPEGIQRGHRQQFPGQRAGAADDEFPSPRFDVLMAP